MKTLKNCFVPMNYSSDAARWNAVMHRDANADGKFLYSVKTTGVYCRPSCASKLAKRENVEFHESCIAAERAGFRPCKRCQPDGETVDEFHKNAVARACELIATSENSVRLDSLAKSVGMSSFHFHRVFKQLTGLTPKGYEAAHRSERMRKQLREGSSVTEAIYQAGYNSSSRFYSKSSQTLGMQAKAFRQGGAGVTIRLAVGECSLGSILVACSDKGICAISLGEDPNQLVEELQDQFPKAELVGGDKKFERVVAQVVGFVELPQTGLNLPLDLRGTVFQQRVWKVLQEIPVGSTTSYSEIAKRIGAPKSVRAVASAIASNKLAVVIPCHRVLHLDGSISGYRWGVERKRLLLKKEHSAERKS